MSFLSRFFSRHLKPEFGTPGPREEGGDLPPHLYGVIAEFATAGGARSRGSRGPQGGLPGHRGLHALSRSRSCTTRSATALRACRSSSSWAGSSGGLFGFFLQYWTSAVDYPLNIGGRPYNSWVSFIPITFECTILFAGIAAVLGMLVLNGLPMPYHPVFSVPRFQLASRDRYFLMILARDPRFRAGDTFRFMETLGASLVSDVED